MAAACARVKKHVLLILLLCSGALGACPYARHLNVSAPNLEALSGSCLLIPCTFTTSQNVEHQFDPTKPVKAIWRNPYAENVYEFSSNDGPRNGHPGKMIGNVLQKNCTALFSDINSAQSIQYYFRIENDQYKATDFCAPLQITVKDSPWSPSVKVSGHLMEKEKVTITCSALTPCPESPPKLSWNLHHNPLQSMSTNTDGTFSSSIRQSLTLSDRHDGLQVNCTAVYPVKGGEKRSDNSITLRVEYSPKNTSVDPSVTISLSEGQSMNLSCSSRAWPPVNFTWFRVSFMGPQRVHEGHVYSLVYNNVTPGQYFCQAKNQVGEQNSPEIRLELEGMINVPWVAIIGGGVGLLMLICSVLLIWRLFPKRQTPVEPQTETYANVDRAEDTVHYGEIVFKPKPTEPTAMVQRADDQEETVYSQVRVSKAAESTTQPSQDIYATVKKR